MCSSDLNGQTRGAAAELASRLRAAKAGVVIGSGNAAAGLAPDIAVAVGADEEKIYFANPFAVTMTNNPAALPAKNDLRAFVDHMTEAELVRRKINFLLVRAHCHGEIRHQTSR